MSADAEGRALRGRLTSGRVRHLCIALAVGAVSLWGGLEPLERLWMDVRFRLLQKPVEAPIVVVAIDPRSLSRLDVWPWPRGYHATVLERLLASGATRVAFDLDFSSRSIPEEDDAFAEAVRAAEGRAILPVFHRWQAEPDGSGGLIGSAPLASLSARATLASINIRPEADGLVRRYWPVDASGGPPAPSMALALMGGEPGDHDGFYLDYGLDTTTIPVISYVDVLTGEFDPAAIRGRAVIVGATAVELGDQVAVPVYVNLPGPMLQSLAFVCIQTGRGLHRLPIWFPAVVVLAAAWLAGRTLERAPWRRGILLLFGLVGGVLVVSVAAQHLGAILLDVSPVCVTLAGSYALGLVRRIDQQSLSLVTQALRVRTTEARMRHVVENSSDAIVTVSQTGRVETFNPAAERLFGLPASEAIGAKLESLVPEGIAPNGAEAPPRREVLARRRDGSSFTAELSVTSFTLEGRALDVAFLRDITDQKAQQWALEHQATHDVLTDLPNRLMLQRRAEVCLESARREESPSAFLILDLDRFKEVNDTLGHHTGDRLLQMISRRLTEPLRPEETIARTGGDEFAVIIPGAGLAEARASAERLVEALEEPFDLDGLRLLVETSIGIALFPDHGTDPATLLRRGDVAMYQAKKRRNAIAVYDPLQDLNSVRHLTLRGELREAIEKDQLVLHYQPKVSGRTGCVEGVEALVRWRHPKHGLLPPAEFIPLAESTGLMREVTAWVLDSAFAQWARWDKEGLSLSLAVNCSARNLLEEDLPALMDSGLRARGMPASRLVVELTETAIIEDPGRSLKALDALATLGVRLSIDDFGTGYSSLEQLRRLPARELKIDKSFVARMDEDEGNIVIVRSTIDLAHNLGLEAVAEGVCSEAVWRRLRDLGCDLGQGFHLGRPMPAHAVAPWIAARGSGEMPGELIRPSAG